MWYTYLIILKFSSHYDASGVYINISVNHPGLRHYIKPQKDKTIELLKKKIISIISEKDNEYLLKLDDKEKTILLLKKRLIEIMNDIDLNNVTIKDIDIDIINDIE